MRAARTIATASRVLEEALLAACDEGDVDAVTETLKNGANMNMICKSGRTPFCTAAHSGNTHILKLMIDYATGKRKPKESVAECLQYLCDSGASTDDELLPDEDSASKGKSGNKGGESSDQSPCHCSESGTGETCDRCAENKTPSESESVNDPRFSLKRNLRLKLLPLEIQTVLDSFVISNGQIGIQQYDLQLYDYNHGRYDFDRYDHDYDSDEYEYEYSIEGFGPGEEGDTEEYGSEEGIEDDPPDDNDGSDDDDDDGDGDAPDEDDDEIPDDEEEEEEEEDAFNDDDDAAAPDDDYVPDYDAPENDVLDADANDGAIVESSSEESDEGAPVEGAPGGSAPTGNTAENASGAAVGRPPLDADASEEESLEEDSVDEDSIVEDSFEAVSFDGDFFGEDAFPQGRNIRDSVMARSTSSTWRSGIFTKTDCLTHKIPNPKSLNKRDHFGCRAVHYAIMGGHKDALKLLIEAGCKVNVGDLEQLAPIHIASARESPEELLLLVKAGAYVNVKTLDKITPLHVASSRGLLENVKILIEKGAQVNVVDCMDRSPLFMAVSRCHKEVVSYLINKGAKLNVEEIHGYTPLYEAVSQRNLEIVRLLIKAGAKITHSKNLLHHAVLYRNEDVVRELIEAGCIVNAKEDNGDTALIIAAKTLQPRIVQILLEHGALVNIKNSESGEAALVQMTKNLRGKWDAFEEIFSLFQKFDLEIDGETGYKALHYAIYNAEDAVAALLIRRGAIVFHKMWDVYAQLATDLFLEALLRDNRLLLKLLIYAGYNFRSLRLPNRISPSLLEWLRRRRSKPLKLGELCRIVVRSKLKNKVFERVSLLNIPSSIQSYIRLENVT